MFELIKDFYYKETKEMGIVAVSRQKSNIGTKSSVELNFKTSRNITPLWYKSYISKAGEYDFTEVPFISNRKVISLYNFGKKPVDARINLLRANASFKRLLIYKTKLGNFHQIQLTYIPDYDYLEKNNFDASANQINKIKVGFNGYIEYSSVKDEKKIFVLRFEKGKLVSKIYFKNNNTTNNVSGIKQDIKGRSSIMSVKDNGIIVNGGRFEEICTPIMKQECFEVGDPPVETCGDWIQVGDNCEDVWVEDPPEGPGDDPCYDEFGFYICDPENPEEPSPPVDCAGVQFGTAVMADCGCIGGTTGIEDCSKEPCDEADRMNYQSEHAQLAAENLALSNTPNDVEYGTEERLTSIPGNDYNSSNIGSNGVHGFTPTFTWNVSEGFTIGFNHKHTNGTGPSPADIMTPYEFSARPALISSGQQQYYKDNVTIGTISGSNYYKMTIADWEL